MLDVYKHHQLGYTYLVVSTYNRVALLNDYFTR